MEDCHGNETQVARALAFPVNSQERRAAFAKLRREGDYVSSVENLKQRSHARAVREGKGDNELSPCPHCYGFFQAKFLWKHSRHCPAQLLAKDSDEKPGHNILKSSRALLATSMVDNKNHRQVVDNIISTMNQDKYTLMIKTDQLLLTYGAVMLEKDGMKRKGEISYKLKSLAKLLEKFQELKGKENSTSKDLIDPKNWDLLVQSVKLLTGYDEAQIKIPSLFLKLGYSLQHLSRVARSSGLKNDDDGLVKKCKSFLDLYETEWAIYTTRIRIQFDNNRSKAPQNLPLANDIKLLREYCQSEIERLLNLKKLSKGDWRLLAETTLCRIITFNARRGGEPPALTLEEWQDALNDKWKKTEALSFLSESEQHLAERLKVVYILGKRRRKVPILFTEETIAAVQCVVQNRGIAGVSPNNKYVFARQYQDSLNHLDGWHTVKTVASKASLSKPELISSTRIRKELATTLQLLDMNEAELTWVSNHLGHSVNVHRQWYRQEESTMELTKVARVLMAKDDGVNFHNKKMKDLTAPTTGDLILLSW